MRQSRGSELQEIQEVSRDELQQYINHRENMVVYRSPLAEIDKIFLLLLSIILVDVLAFAFPQTLWRVPLGTIYEVQVGLLVPLVAILPIAILLWILHRLYDERHVIGMEAIIQISGLQGLVTKSTQIYFRNIRAIKIERRGFQRIFDLGDLRIGDMFGDTAGVGNPDIIMNGIRNPEQFKSVIERRIRAQLKPNQEEEEVERPRARSRSRSRTKSRSRQRSAN